MICKACNGNVHSTGNYCSWCRGTGSEQEARDTASRASWYDFVWIRAAGSPARQAQNAHLS